MSKNFGAGDGFGLAATGDGRAPAKGRLINGTQSTASLPIYGLGPEGGEGEVLGIFEDDPAENEEKNEKKGPQDRNLAVPFFNNLGELVVGDLQPIVVGSKLVIIFHGPGGNLQNWLPDIQEGADLFAVRWREIDEGRTDRSAREADEFHHRFHGGHFVAFSESANGVEREDVFFHESCELGSIAGGGCLMEEQGEFGSDVGDAGSEGADADGIIAWDEIIAGAADPEEAITDGVLNEFESADTSLAIFPRDEVGEAGEVLDLGGGEGGPIAAVDDHSEGAGAGDGFIIGVQSLPIGLGIVRWKGEDAAGAGGCGLACHFGREGVVEADSGDDGHFAVGRGDGRANDFEMFGRGERVKFAGAAGGDDGAEGMPEQSSQIIFEAIEVERKIFLEGGDWKSDDAGELMAESLWVHKMSERGVQGNGCWERGVESTHLTLWSPMTAMVSGGEVI